MADEYLKKQSSMGASFPKNIAQNEQVRFINMNDWRNGFDQTFKAPGGYRDAQKDAATQELENLTLSIPNYSGLMPLQKKAISEILYTAYPDVDREIINNNLNEYYKGLTGADLTESTWQEFVNMFEAFDTQAQIADLQNHLMKTPEGSPLDEYYEKEIAELQKQVALKTKDFENRGALGKAFIQFGGLANQRVKQIANSIETAIVLGIFSSAVSGSQMGVNAISANQVRDLETLNNAMRGSSLVMNPDGTYGFAKSLGSGFGTSMAKYGMAAGNQLYMNNDMLKMEMGEAFQQIREYRDEEGNRVPKDIAVKYATDYGTLVLVTEQFDEISSIAFGGLGLDVSNPLTRLNLGKEFFQSVKQIMDSNSFLSTLKFVAGRGLSAVGEMSQEGIQAAGQKALELAAIAESNRRGYTKIQQDKFVDEVQEVWTALKDTFMETSGEFLISTLLDTGAGFVSHGIRTLANITPKMRSDANANFNPGGKIVNPMEIDTMGAEAKAPEKKVDAEGKEIESKLDPILVDSPDANGVQRGYSQRDRQLIQWARENNITGIRVIEVPFKSNQSAAERLAQIINEEAALNTLTDNDTEDRVPVTDLSDNERDVDTSITEGPIIGTKTGTLLVKDRAGLEKTLEYFKKNSFTSNIIRNADGSVTVRMTAGSNVSSVDIRIASEAEQNGTDPVEPVRSYHDWATLETERKSGDPYNIDNYLRNYEEEMAYQAIDEALPESEKMSFNQRRALQFSKLGAARIMPIVSEVTGMKTKDILDKFVFTFDTTGKLKESRSYGGFEVINGKLNVKIRIDTAVRPDTIMHEVIHGLRRLATSEQLSGFAEAYGGAVGGMWVEDIKKTDNGWVLGDKTYKTHDEALEAASKYEERFVDDFMRYLYGETGFNDAQKSFFAKVKQFFEVFWDRMRSILADKLDAKTVKAFDILFGKDTPAQERADFVEVAATEGIKVATELASTALEDETRFSGETNQMLHHRIMDRNTQARIDADYEAVENALRADASNFDSEGNHLAPNGEKSNLTYKQWVQVRTPAFMDWFGDWLNDPENASKIVDENGEPKVVFHGATAKFDTFAKRSDIGFHFGTRLQAEEVLFIHSSEMGFNEEEAQMLETFLNIRNPITGITDPGAWTGDNLTMAQEMLAKGYISDVTYKGLDRMFMLDDLYNRVGDPTRMNDVLRKELISKGYDGIIYTNLFEGAHWENGVEVHDESYMVFHPNQIKSATDNVGTFDSGNDSILYQVIGKVGAKNFANDLDQMYIIKDLQTAIDMENNSEPMNKIQMATGWTRRKDGKWRRWLADDYAKFNLPVTYNGYLDLSKTAWKLGEIYSNDDLYSAYPELKDYKVQLKRNWYESDYQPSNKTIHIGLKLGLMIGNARERAFGSLMHEVQHAIQYIEGFAQGTSTGGVIPDILDSLNYISEHFFEFEVDDVVEMNRANKTSLEDYKKGLKDAETLYRNALGEAEARETERFALSGQYDPRTAFDNEGSVDGVKREDQIVILDEITKESGYDNLFYQKTEGKEYDYDGTIKITPGVKKMFEEDKNAIPESSNWHGVLFQLESVSANVKTSYKDTSYVAYEVSMQPEVQEKFNSKEWKESDFEITSFEQARFINTNEERQKDWQSLYAEAMAAQWTKHKKDGSVEHVPISFGMMKKDADGGKVQSIPCVNLSTGCQRIRTVIERIENGILPADTPIESCYGGTCFVNLDQAHKLYGTENVDTKDLVMVTPDDIKKWFKQKATRTFLQRPNGFIRMGFRGDCAHSFPILDGWNTSLAETWLQSIKDYDIRNPKTGEYMKTIFITAGYAPTTEESYARLVPFKDMCEIHVSTSGWFSKNELMLRLAEYDVMNRLGLNVSLRVVTDKNQLSDSPFNNTNWLKHMIFDVLKVPQSQLLGTAYHNDNTRKHSEFDQDFENQCCVTGKCASCKVGCMSLVEKIEKGYKREDAPFGTQFVTDEDYLHKNGSKTGLILLQSIDTSPTTEIQPQDNSNYLTVDRTKQEEPGMLYQLTDEERAKAIQARKNEIEYAVNSGEYWVRTEYLEEFEGEDWADRELMVRHWMNEHPEDWQRIRELAYNSEDYQDFKDQIVKDSDEQWTDRDEELYSRLYKIASFRTSSEKDTIFIARHVMGDKELIETAKLLRGFADIGFVSRPKKRSHGYYRVTGLLNMAKGVSSKVKAIKETSTSKEIQEAREIILKNPRPYRMAFDRAQLGEQRAGIIRGMGNKRFEVSKVSQESNDITANWDFETVDDRLEEELESLEKEKAELERKANISKVQETDWKKTAEELEKKLADAEADLAKLNTEKLSKEQAQKERDKAIAERTELRRQMTSLQNDLADQTREAKEFKAQRDERRRRVAELRTKLVDANRKIKTLTRILNAYERKETARLAKEARENMLAKIRRTVRIGKTTFSWHKDALDASYADAFAFINSIFAKVDRKELYARRKKLEGLIDDMIDQQRDPKEIEELEEELENVKEQIRGSEMRKVPDILVPYLGTLQKADNRHSKWTLEELSDLLTVAQTIRQLAKDSFAPRFDAVRSKRNKTVVDYVQEVSGIDISKMKADERRKLASTFPKDALVKNVVLEKLDWWRALAANPAGMTRFFDGEKEGVIFDFFTRQVRQLMEQEIARENERYQAGEKKLEELGLNSFKLNKIIELEDGYTFKKANGEKVKLTVDNGIDVYIYMQNEDAKMKLLHVSGNGMTEELANRIINALTPEQKAWGDWMMQELESHREDSADIMYRIYNSVMGKVDKYFPLVSADKLYGGDDGIDIMSGAEGSTKRFVNKGHTKERVKVIYPLDLNATRTWVTAVKREEHFVAFAEWARDAQYYMDTKTPAGIKNVILQKYGPKNVEIFADYVNSIASAKSYSDNVDKLLSTIIGRGAVSAVAGKFSVMFKQLATLPASIGKTSIKNFFGSAFAPRITLENFLKANDIVFADYSSARDFVNKKDPIMANRKYGTELIGSLTNMGKSPVDTVASNVSEWLMRHSAGATDSYITKVVWLSCYMTTFEKLKEQAKKKGITFNATEAEKEAVFQAGQLISETQNTALDTDMSYLMRKAKAQPALKPFVLFSSTPMNLMTNLAYGIPRHYRNKNWKAIVHTVAYVTLAMLGNMAINGAFKKKKDEDDEEYAKRMWLEIGAETVSTLMPGYGGSFANMIRGNYTDTTGDISLVSDISRAGSKVIKKLTNPKSNQTGWELIGEMLYVGAESFGFPAGALKNLVKSAYNLNPGYMVNKTFAEIFEENFK